MVGASTGMKMKVRVMVLTLALLIPAVSVSAESEEPWVFEGGGWGHGVGLSQFGTLGQVEDGESVESILQYYYEGTEVGSVPGSHWTNGEGGLRIGIVPNTGAGGAVHIEAVGSGTVTVCQPSSECSQVDEPLTTEDTWHFDVRENEDTQEIECRVRRGSGETSENWGWGPCDARVTQPANTDTRIAVNGIQYAHGTLHLTPSSDGFHTVVALSMEKYLRGLAEVPSGWPEEALQVQAIAGRSYAVATAMERGGSDGSGRLSSCDCHLLATTLDQAYVGWAKEDPANEGDPWTQAVVDTAGQVVTLNGSTVKTFYSSSNGGASENNEDVWGGDPRSYLRSVEDPWSADPAINPLATWSVRVSDDDLAGYFGWDRALDAFVLQGPPGVLIEFTGWDDGGPVSTTLDGPDLVSLVRATGFGYFAPGSPDSSSIRVSPYFTSVIDPPGFDDIIGDTFEKDIEWLGDQQVTKGCNPPDNTEFCPDDLVTRGQMAAFLNRYLDLPAASLDHFVDDDGTTFEGDINRLAEAGITKGCNPPDNTMYCADDPVTREQMAAFIVRALDLTANDHEGFTDVAASNTFAADIGKLATAGITRGCNPPGNDMYCPNEDVTRGQIAAFLHRADEVE